MIAPNAITWGVAQFESRSSVTITLIFDQPDRGEKSSMKVMTVFGTRPEIIRLSRVIAELDRFCEHIVVHTGQNYDNLNDVFSTNWTCASWHPSGHQRRRFADQADIISHVRRWKEKPDRVLI
jgi:UDP-N-acetylglucosamine 2-epimerase (non-hydrolysing)